MMNRRNIILAQSGPAPPVIPVPPNAISGMFAVYSGIATMIPPSRTYSQMAPAVLTNFLQGLVPSGPDQAELSQLNIRAQHMGVGEIDQVRLSTLNIGPNGEPGLVQIVRLR